jgi:hypothetical protein
MRSLQRALAFEAFATLITEEVGALWVTVETATLNDFEFGQQCGQCAGRGRFGGAAFAANQHAANLRVDRVQNQGAFHAFLPYDCGKWICLSHGVFLHRRRRMPIGLPPPAFLC